MVRIHSLGLELNKEIKKDKITQHKEYIELLKKRLDSKNYKNNIPEEEYEETKKKYEKAKLVLGILK